ncbi:MAG: UDP-glucose 4-epimerase (EC [uncultured Campylobacterales bacterium]|uniref:UDP-glucose 4-epimerase (EC) n=1 Tax=uncultured Campylobacterales bacterium TaxID=352960 RepID=A0A6S6T4Y8_9BACT|nr:MAG: UDP-glucose 4-epimerase (EC [uncultured Campylobacterales bacterium]
MYGSIEISSGKYETLISLFKEKMKNNEKLTVVSFRTQKRNFTHIDDIINELVLVGEGDGFCIGSSESYSIIDIVKMFGGNIEMLDSRKGNRMSVEVIIEKLGWEVKHILKDYING